MLRCVVLGSWPGFGTFSLSMFVLDPDIGMPTADAQRYFKQLISGVVSIL